MISDKTIESVLKEINPDEWVDLGQLADTARIYALTALHYLDPGAGA